MQNQIEIFKNDEFGEIRALEVNGEPYFVGKDVASVLGYSDTSDALKKHVDDEDKMSRQIADSLGRKQNTKVINESGLYSLILSSKLPAAKKFKRWVTSEVLPQIRKHGAYMTDDTLEKALTSPDFLIKLATELKEEKEQRKTLEEKVEKDKPKVLFAEAVENSDDVILVKEMATILTQNGFEIGQNQLFEYLRKYNYLCSKKGGMYNLPTKKHEDLFKVTKRTIQHTKGTEVRNTPKITGKGQLYFIKIFAEYTALGITIKDLLSNKKEAM